MARSASPRSVELSVDGVNFKFLAKPYEFAGTYPTSHHTVNLAVYPELQNLTADKTIYFRLYINGLESREELVGIGSSDFNISNGRWGNLEINKDYTLQVMGTVEQTKK